MQLVTEAGGIIAPPVPAFYTRPTGIEDIVDQTAARILDLFDIEPGGGIKRWGGLRAAAAG
jgi:3-polyprenyl-4-hydroxybenzoate decarboxylase